MNDTRVSIAAAAWVLAALAPAAPAHAAFVLDTGAPVSGATNYTFNSSQFFADEVYLSAGETVTQLSAYLKQGTGSGTQFSFDIYAAGSSFTSNSVTNLNRSGNGYLLYSTNATFAGTGWNSATVNWTPTTSGDYWIAIEAASPTSLYAPSVAGQPNGTAPALGFASASGLSRDFVIGASPAVGMEVSAVPLPAAGWLFASALAGFGALGRRRRAAGAAAAATPI